MAFCRRPIQGASSFNRHGDSDMLDYLPLTCNCHHILENRAFATSPYTTFRGRHRLGRPGNPGFPGVPVVARTRVPGLHCLPAGECVGGKMQNGIRSQFWVLSRSHGKSVEHSRSLDSVQTCAVDQTRYSAHAQFNRQLADLFLRKDSGSPDSPEPARIHSG